MWIFYVKSKHSDNRDYREYCKPIKDVGGYGKTTRIADSQIHHANYGEY